MPELATLAQLGATDTSVVRDDWEHLGSWQWVNPDAADYSARPSFTAAASEGSTFQVRCRVAGTNRATDHASVNESAANQLLPYLWLGTVDAVVMFEARRTDGTGSLRLLRTAVTAVLSSLAEVDEPDEGGFADTYGGGF